MKRTKCLKEMLVYNLIIKMIGVYLDGVEGCKCRPPVLEIWRHHWPRHHHHHHHHHHKQHFHLHTNYHHHQEYWSQFADPGCSGWPGFHWNSSLHLLQTHHCTAHSIGKYPRNLNYEERRSENLSEPFFWQYLKKWRNHAAAIVNFNEYSLFCFKWEIGKINDKWLMKASSSAKTWRWKSESLHGDDLEFFRLTRKKSAPVASSRSRPTHFTAFHTTFLSYSFQISIEIGIFFLLTIFNITCWP